MDMGVYVYGCVLVWLGACLLRGNREGERGVANGQELMAKSEM